MSIFVLTVGLCFYSIQWMGKIEKKRMPESCAKNKSKCAECGDYFFNTYKNIIGVYTIPTLYLILRTLSILTTSRNKSHIDMEKTVLRKIIYAFFFLTSFLLLVPLKNLPNSNTMWNRLAQMGLVVLILIV